MRMRAQLGCKRARRLSAPIGFEAVEPGLEEALLPAGDGGRGGIEFGFDGVVAGPRRPARSTDLAGSEGERSISLRSLRYGFVRRTGSVSKGIL